MSMNFGELNDVKPIGTAEKPIVLTGLRHKLYTLGFKRLLDVMLVLISLPVVVPLVGFCAILVSLDGHNPFYSQMRVGRQGRHFRIWKLRSMVPDAKGKLDDYLSQNASARAEWSRTQKLKNDPRITPIGRVLRKASLDELPQLWNVLNGSMSLVGPRPMMPEQENAYPGTAYYQLRPGITGFWQVSRRNHSSFAARARYDNEYRASVCLGTDLAVLLRTFRVVVRGTGY